MNAKRLSWTVLIAVALAACNAQTTRLDASAGDSNPIDDLGGSAAFGAPCIRNADCHSDVCLSNGHCSLSCGTTGDCLPGWTCGPPAGMGSLCQCVVSGEVCDGRDNDCDGIVDDGASCPGLGVCIAGACFAGTFDVAQGDATDIVQPRDSACDAVVLPGMDAGTCLRAATCDNSAFCPSLVTNVATHPQYVIAQIDVLTPTVLGPRGAIGGLLNSAIVTGKFFWGLDIDLLANTIRTGGLLTDMPEQSGAGFLTNDFHFMMGGAPPGDAGTANRWDPVTGTVALSGESFSTSLFSIVRVPVFEAAIDGGLPMVLLELPLRQFRLRDVQMTSSRNCIGLAKSPFASCLTNRWNTTDPTTDAGTNSFGVLEGDLTVADADGIVIAELPGSPTLCGLIAGTGSNCSSPISTWRSPAEATASGPGWHLVANFAGYAARIH